MAEVIWLSMDEVCNLTGEVRETVRRKCKYHAKVIARDYSNIKANEYWIIESCQLKFPLKRGKRYFYPWLTVVKDGYVFFTYHRGRYEQGILL